MGAAGDRDVNEDNDLTVRTSARKAANLRIDARNRSTGRIASRQRKKGVGLSQ
jgi:hypothetical protein